VRGSPVSTGMRPVTVTLDPAARYAFVVNAGSDNVSVYRGMSNTSPLHSESRKYGSPFAAGKEPVALALEPTGRYAYVANAGSNDISVFHIHHQSGALASIPGSPFKTGQRPVALAAHPNGRWLIVANRDSADVRLYSIETEHGALAPQGQPVRLPAPPKSMWLNPAGTTLYVLTEDGRRLLSYKVDAAAGSLSQLQGERLTQPITDMTFRVESRR
jgi:6-phosphogluconolactonase (cycloisomerase 2 family)